MSPHSLNLDSREWGGNLKSWDMPILLEQMVLGMRVDFVVGEVPVQVHSHEGGTPEGLSSRVFLNLSRMHEYRNPTLSKQLFLFPCFFSVGLWEHIKLGSSPSITA
jgi:hypothetical protein